MGVNAPGDLHKSFSDAFNSGNVDALMALYEPDASLVPSAWNDRTRSSVH